MKIKLLSILLLLNIVLACSNDSSNVLFDLNSPSAKPVAIVNGEINIYQNQLDSLIQDQLFEINLRTINYLVSNELLQLEAKNKNMSINALTYDMITSKADIITQTDIITYININNLSYIDTLKIREYLTNLSINARQLEYLDSLKFVYDINYFICPSSKINIQTDKLFSLDLNDDKASQIDVFIISSFNCPACQRVQPKMKKIIKKYNNFVNFKFIYFADYVSNSAIACVAAKDQGMFYEFYDKLIAKPMNNYSDSILNSVALTINLNITDFQNDIKNKTNLKEMLETKEFLISSGVFVTPSFIINGNLYDDSDAIFYLDNLIANEIIYNIYAN